MAPGITDTTGLELRPAFARASSWSSRARKSDPTRAKLALAAIRRLNALRDGTNRPRERHPRRVEQRSTTHLQSIPGVGPLVAAKILGEVRDVRQLSQRGSVRRSCRRRPGAGLQRQHPTASPGPREATANSTGPCSPSQRSKPAGTPPAREYPLPANEPRARPRRSPPVPEEAPANVVYRSLRRPRHRPRRRPQPGCLTIAAPQPRSDHPPVGAVPPSNTTNGPSPTTATSPKDRETSPANVTEVAPTTALTA